MDYKKSQPIDMSQKASLLLAFSILLPTLGMAQTTGNPDALVTLNKTNGAPQFGRLAPDQIQGVQFVGKAVLGAKGNQPKDATVQALRDQLAVLSNDLNQATVITPPSSGFAIQKNGTSQQSISPIAASVDKTDAVLRTHMSNLEQARMHVLDTANQSQSPEKAVHLGAMSATVAALVQELNTALSSSGAERFAKLSALRNKLQIQSSTEVAKQGRSRAITAGITDLSTQGSSALPDAETPMLTTIVRHR